MVKLKNIEFLRVFLISVIILLHTTAYGSWSLMKNFPDVPQLKFFHDTLIQSNNSVEGFFLIAGFLFIYTFKNQSIKDFIVKKYIRLSPVILFAVLICIIASLWHVIKLRFWDDILVVLLMNNFGYCFAHGTTPVLWFTSALFSGLLVYFCISNIKNAKVRKFLYIFLPLVSYGILEYLQQGSFSSSHKNYLIFNIGFLRAIGGIGFGCLVGFLYKKFCGRILSSVYKIIINLSEIGLLGFIVWWLIFPHKQYNCIFFVIAFALLLFLFSLKQGIISKLTDKNLWVKLGKYQYSFYVIHSVAGKILLGALWQNNADFVKFHPYCTISVIIITIIFAGILTYHFVEKPCTGLLKQLVK